MWIILFIFQKYIDQKELNLVCYYLQPKKKFSLDLIPYGSRSHPPAVCFINQSCYLPESFIYPRKFKYMKKALTWQMSTHVHHGLFFLCRANMFPILAPDSSPELETLHLWLMLLESQDVVLWLPGYGRFVPWWLCLKWPGGVTGESSRNRFSLWKTEWVDLYSRQTSVDAIGRCLAFSGHIVGA